MTLARCSRGFSVLVLGVGLLGGCASKVPQEENLLQQAKESSAIPTPQVSAFDQLVSRDVVAVLVQIDRLDPGFTVLSTSEDSLKKGPFAVALTKELQAAGYAIRSVGKGPDSVPVSYEFRDDAAESVQAAEFLRTVTVTAGDVAVRRSYVLDFDGRVIPQGGMQVKGVDARSLSLETGIFSDTPSDNIEPAAVERESGVVPTPVPVPDAVPVYPADSTANDGLLARSEQSIDSSEAFRRQIATGNLLDRIAPTIAATTPVAATSTSTSFKATHNVFDLNRSNFEELFDDLVIVREKVLTFANDSTRMGNDNKVRLQELIERFQPDSDMISVIGCSLGYTGVAGGQQRLAMGRAERVRDELLHAGIPRGKIFDEGCWGEEAYDSRMPRRGVVVTLKRRIG